MAKYINPLCEAARRMMDEYAAGELNKDDREAFEAHLKMCSECRGEYEFLLKLKSMLAGADMPPPADLHERIVAALAVERKNAAKMKRIKLISRYSAVAAGVVLVLALGVTGIYQGIINRSADMAESADGSPLPPLTGIDEATSAETEAAEFTLKSPDAAVQDSVDENGETAEADEGNGMLTMFAAGSDVNEATDEEAAAEEAPEAAEAELYYENETPLLAATAPTDDNAAVTEASTMTDGVFTATESMAAMLYDAPYDERVNSLEYARELLGDAEYTNWYDNTWMNLTLAEKAYEPVLYRVIQDYGIEKSTLEGKFLFTMPSEPVAVSDLTSGCVLTQDMIDALYLDDIFAVREALCNPMALYYNGAIYTYLWLVNCTSAEFEAYAPPASAILVYAYSYSSFFNTDMLIDRITSAGK